MFFEADGAIVSGGLRCSDQNDFAFGPDVGLGLFDELLSDSLFLVAFIDGKVGKVGDVYEVGQCPGNADQSVFIPRRDDQVGVF